jgi:hypothetical protein
MSPVLLIHIGTGLVALIAGSTALTVAKGSAWHRRSGIVFAIAMLTMAAMATYLSLSIPDRGNLPGGLFAAYLVATGWGTIRLKQRAVGAFELWGLAALLAITALTITFALLAQAHPDGLLDGKPAAQFVIAAGFELLAALLDVKVIVRRRLLPAQRTARHIWRMCGALFIAADPSFWASKRSCR